jgi:hypothetical protein
VDRRPLVPQRAIGGEELVHPGPSPRATRRTGRRVRGRRHGRTR